MADELSKLHEEAKKSLLQQSIEEDKISYGEFDDSPKEDEQSFEDYNISYEPTDKEIADMESRRPVYKDNFREPDFDHETVDRFDIPIFPGGPAQSQVNAWKETFQGAKIFIIELDEKMYVYRTLNRHEYKQIVGFQSDALTREEIICKTCTLWPEDFGYKAMANGSAGIPSTYGAIIMESSGFTKDYKVMEI